MKLTDFDRKYMKQRHGIHPEKKRSFTKEKDIDNEKAKDLMFGSIKQYLKTGNDVINLADHLNNSWWAKKFLKNFKMAKKGKEVTDGEIVAKLNKYVVVEI
jgi:hypothetical protein